MKDENGAVWFILHPSSFPGRAHSFASPPYDGFAIVEDKQVTQLLVTAELGEPLLNIPLVKKT
jgi:hypothetical protein